MLIEAPKRDDLPTAGTIGPKSVQLNHLQRFGGRSIDRSELCLAAARGGAIGAFKSLASHQLIYGKRLPGFQVQPIDGRGKFGSEMVEDQHARRGWSR